MPNAKPPLSSGRSEVKPEQLTMQRYAMRYAVRSAVRYAVRREIERGAHIIMCSLPDVSSMSGTLRGAFRSAGRLPEIRDGRRETERDAQIIRCSLPEVSSMSGRTRG